MSDQGVPVCPSQRHSVQFYSSDTFLGEVVAQFVRGALRAGDPCVAIVTAAHRAAAASLLQMQGIETDPFVRRGDLLFLDARETLSTFMVNGMPDSALFKASIGGVIDKLSGRPGRTVRAFGEMVDVLCRQGAPEAAILLEELWNDLATTHRFSLLCGYTMGNFVGESHSDAFKRVCAVHSRVYPTEEYTRVTDDAGRLREISFLQQRARSLESEIERRKNLEATLREMVCREQAARTEAENASRLKDEFLAVLSHELRTPLNAILGWTQMIDAGTEERTLAHALDVIRRNAKLQLHLIDDLLDISRIITGKMVLNMESVNMGTVLNAAIETVRPATEAKGITLDVQVSEPAPIITGDANRLQQVVWNLLTNAVKFTSEGGVVHLRLEQEAAQIRIIVQDTGQGIEPDFLPYVFDRFRQGNTGTTRRVGGLGIGLAVVRYLAEAHGGRVAADSAGVGCGATFTVTLPVNGRSQQNQASDTAKRLQGVRVLVVDDERDACDLFTFILEEAGAVVQVARSADDALRLLSADSFDLILADIGMPASDGFALISAIRSHPLQHVRGIRAIAVTSYATENIRSRALSLGYDGYITKPVQPHELAQIASNYLLKGKAA